METKKEINISEENIAAVGKVVHIISLVKHGVIAAGCFISAIVLYVDSLQTNDGKVILLFVAASFFLVSLVLVSRMFPQMQLYETLSSSGKYINLGLLGMVFIGIAVSMLYHDVQSGVAPWSQILFDVLFIFVSIFAGTRIIMKALK